MGFMSNEWGNWNLTRPFLAFTYLHWFHLQQENQYYSTSTTSTEKVDCVCVLDGMYGFFQFVGRIIEVVVIVWHKNTKTNFHSIELIVAVVVFVLVITVILRFLRTNKNTTKKFTN